jgi:hypothetical protein
MIIEVIDIFIEDHTLKCLNAAASSLGTSPFESMRATAY